MRSSTSHGASHDLRRELALWAGVLSGPIVFLMLLDTNYVLAYVACETRQRSLMHLAALAAVALVAASGWFASRSGPAEEDERTSPPATRETMESRPRWMAMAAIVTSVWFVLAILATEQPLLVLHVCD